MSCSANSDLPMKIKICIEAANTVFIQFDIATISVKSFGALCSSTYVQAVSLEPEAVYRFKQSVINEAISNCRAV